MKVYIYIVQIYIIKNIRNYIFDFLKFSYLQDYIQFLFFLISMILSFFLSLYISKKN